MKDIVIPGVGTFKLEHLVLDFNGTLALNGSLLPGVADRIRLLSDRLAIHVVTADTFGSATRQLANLPVSIHILEPLKETGQKKQYIETLGKEHVAAIGNGNNDIAMLKTAALGIAVIGHEGCSSKVMHASDILVNNIQDGMDLFISPERIIATLRE